MELPIAAAEMNFGKNIQGRGFRPWAGVNRAVAGWINVFRVFQLPFLPLCLLSHTTPFVRVASRRALETVHLQLVRLREPGFRQKLADILPLVTLQLQNLAVLRMLNYSAIACEFLLTCPHDFL